MSKLININQLRTMLAVRGKPVSRSTIYEWVKNGNIPKPVKHWGSPLWDEEEVRKSLQGYPVVV